MGVEAKVGPDLRPVIQTKHSLDERVHIIGDGEGPGAAAILHSADGVVVESRPESRLHRRGGSGEAQLALGDAGFENGQAVAVGEILETGDIGGIGAEQFRELSVGQRLAGGARLCGGRGGRARTDADGHLYGLLGVDGADQAGAFQSILVAFGKRLALR